MKTTRKRMSRMVIVLSCAAMLSCTSQFATQMRKVTYPPDFVYTEKRDLRSGMAELAQQLVSLEYALIHMPENTIAAKEAQRNNVLYSLREMQRIASTLKASRTGANHPFMEDYMQEFIATVDKARGAASIENPRYYFAGKVSGACTSCHSINR